MKAIAVEHHFPWYIDSSDTSNIDCQCGHPCDGMAGWATHLTGVMNVSFIEKSMKFVEVWGDAHLAGDLAGKLRCAEVEALAEMLTALGASLEAATWIDLHAPSDECDDMHCRCDDCEKD